MTSPSPRPEPRQSLEPAALPPRHPSPPASRRRRPADLRLAVDAASVPAAGVYVASIEGLSGDWIFRRRFRAGVVASPPGHVAGPGRPMPVTVRFTEGNGLYEVGWRDRRGQARRCHVLVHDCRQWRLTEEDAFDVACLLDEAAA